jgi:hypothetical protein
MNQLGAAGIYFIFYSPICNTGVEMQISGFFRITHNM